MSTTLAPRPDFDTAQDLGALHSMLDAIGVKNGWNKPTPSLYPQPKQPFLAAHWAFADARAALHAAGRLVGTEWAERRNLILANPMPGNEYPTVTTLVAAYQMVKAGEAARSHRHTPNAMRVVVEAKPGTYTVVDGRKVEMAPGDVLLTPNWSYHGHSNESDHDAYWIDVLDAPLVQMLGPMFFEHHPEQFERDRPVDAASPMRFPYADYGPKLLASAEVAPGVRTLELGAGQVDSFDRVAVSLDAGSTWRCERSTSNQIFIVGAGEGHSLFGDREAGTARGIDWKPGDVLAAPSWIAQE
ncbi:MAG: hypothetical protein JWQ11_4114, partial [Rhizobacter sp.]|nr:hypothetical protein [Rhizobacter sp.]